MPPDPLRIHPAMAHTYRDRVGALICGLSDAEAQEALRAHHAEADRPRRIIRCVFP